MKEKDYKKNIILGIVFDILSLFILGMIFAVASYCLFDKNYKNSLHSTKKRNASIWGKAVAIFLFAESASYHGQSKDIPLDERMVVACIVGLIFSVIGYFIMKSKDKKILLENDSKNKTSYFKCGNCGAEVKEDDIKCPNCGEYFDNEEDDGKIFKDNELTKEDFEEKLENEVPEVKEKSKKQQKSSNIDQKYNDLTKLKELLDKEIITKEEFDKEKKKILKD